MSYWEKIFAEEYDLPESEAGEEVDEWLDEYATQDSFEDFYREAIGSQDTTTFTPGKNRAYSLEAFEDDEDLNCDGQSFVGALAAEEKYDLDVELVMDYGIKKQDQMMRREGFQIGMPSVSNHHVVVEVENEVFGNRAPRSMFPGERRTDRISGEEIASLYFLSMGREADAMGESERAEELFEASRDLQDRSGYINMRLGDWQ